MFKNGKSIAYLLGFLIFVVALGSLLIFPRTTLTTQERMEIEGFQVPDADTEDMGGADISTA